MMQGDVCAMKLCRALTLVSVSLILVVGTFASAQDSKTAPVDEDASRSDADGRGNHGASGGEPGPQRTGAQAVCLSPAHPCGHEEDERETHARRDHGLPHGSAGRQNPAATGEADRKVLGQGQVRRVFRRAGAERGQPRRLAGQRHARRPGRAEVERRNRAEPVSVCRRQGGRSTPSSSWDETRFRVTMPIA